MNDYPDWQPIATAPKDGSFILVVVSGYHPETGKPFIPEAVWWAGEHWCTGSDDYFAFGGSFTHWMPAPPNPALS